ncbi:hypothetical protein [Coxiella-like endosymbiont]|uniref:hypothetical protein n=1 Tax=Coxiella-like endosymbiont TaxID=1592897 RepID=UPI00272D3560|nr:hypothetical protein [Coxiella-like endosymbiont]
MHEILPTFINVSTLSVLMVLSSFLGYIFYSLLFIIDFFDVQICLVRSKQSGNRTVSF